MQQHYLSDYLQYMLLMATLTVMCYNSVIPLKRFMDPMIFNNNKMKSERFILVSQVKISTHY